MTSKYAIALEYFERQLKKAKNNREAALKRGDPAGALGCKRKIEVYETGIEAIRAQLDKRDFGGTA